MLTQNSGDLRKARSNHWFFAYDPIAVAAGGAGGNSIMMAPGVPDTTAPFSWRSYGYYFGFLGAAVLCLYTQIAFVHPVYQSWHEASLEAFGFQHIMARSQHERLARKFHAKATFDLLQGYKARIHAAHGIHESQQDAQNATQMYQMAKQAWEDAKADKRNATVLGNLADDEHQLYLQYLAEASQAEQRAQELEEEAQTLNNQSEYYHHLVDKLNAMLEQDSTLESSYLANATLEGEEADNITLAAQEKKDSSWICRWSVTRHLLCGPVGGMTALGDADALRQEQAEDYRRAMAIQKQILVEKTNAMIALTKASKAEEDARLDHLKAMQSHNESLADKVKASEEHALELDDLQKKLEEMKLVQQHIHDLEYYQGLEVKLEIKSRKENEFAHGQWRLGTSLIQQSEKEEERAKVEYDLVQEEEEAQSRLVITVRQAGRLLRWTSFFAAVYALVAFGFFIKALTTSNSVSLPHQLRTVAVAVSVTVVRRWDGRHMWEGRSILGDSQDRNCLRQISCWCHHGLIFLFVVGMQGWQLHGIFDVDSLGLRGGLVLKFALTAALMETVLFQAVPHAAVLPRLTKEYFRDVAIRFLSSACRFTVQMLLFLILCGEGSTWLFGWIAFLNHTFPLWGVLLVGTVVAHMMHIEFPHVCDLDRNNGALSEVTFTTYTTCEDLTSYRDSRVGSYASNSWSPSKQLSETEKGKKKGTFAILSPANISSAEDEAESLLTVSRADVPVSSALSSMSSYTSIPMNDSGTSTSGEGTAPVSLPSPALQRLYEVSIQDEFFAILAYVELILLVGIMLVVSAAMPQIFHRLKAGAASTSTRRQKTNVSKHPKYISE
ncbi:expressed unknown protein [Seminavis robusta]|uniref:Uncharacterized protein n=1 Tax=Seminavis robusta TaxID=568900 RepID=A0A9N8HS22_9STRA|nr:expressed unknown protein [Seminavis robusta]|eukprot:Sro1336_g264010.1 n/a (837) ;mRNA; f:9508-12101